MKMLLILFFLLMSYLSVSAAPISITDHPSSYDLGPHIQVLEDKSGTLSFEEVSSKHFNQKFKPSTVAIPKFGFTDSVIWLKQTVRYETDSDFRKVWIVSLNYPLLDYVSLYVQESRKTMYTFHSGDHLPFDQRTFNNRFFRFPVELTSNQDTVIYLRIQSQSSIILPLVLMSDKAMNITDQKEMLILGMFYGVLIILILYNLVSYFIVRHKSYLYYVYFVFSYALLQVSLDGLGVQYLWSNSHWLVNDAVAVFVGMSIISSIMLGQVFLESQTKTPKLHRYLNVIVIVTSMTLLLSPFSLYPITIRIMTGLAIITSVLLMIMGYKIYRMGYAPARLYLLSWIVFFIGTIVLSLNKFGLIPSHWMVCYAQQFGVLIKVFVLSVALGMRMYYLAFHDNLTGLGNRNALDKIIDRAIYLADRKKNNFSVFFLDLDDFKDVNDSMGHAAGDELLQELARRLKKRLRQTDMLIRQGGDEFIIIYEDLHNSEDTTKIAHEILSLIRVPFDIKNKQIYLTASLGIAYYPQDGKDADTLIKNADAAMFKAKSKGKNKFYFFDEALDKAAKLRLNTLNDLHHALSNGEFVLYYQPQLSTVTQKIMGIEALIRWNHPTRGFLGPDAFIEEAERSDLIVEIGEWVLNEICRQIIIWKNIANLDFHVAANISVKQFSRGDFVKKVHAILEEYAIAPSMIELEITESMLVTNKAKTIKQLHKLHLLGFKIAIDDFGTGYSSFSYMRSFTIDTIKIDKSFIDTIENDQQSRIVTKAMITLGHNMNMQVVAEGVENKHQFDLLKEMNCDIIQGFYYDKPILPDLFAEKYIKGTR